jgi:hypothetical protein
MTTLTMALMELTDNSFEVIKDPSNQEEFEIYVKNNSEKELPTYYDIIKKLTELQAAEPLRLLRQQRNQLLTATDWWVLPDRTPTQAQLDYRQALRDLPTNSPNAALDENGQLINVTWPTEPGA